MVRKQQWWVWFVVACFVGFSWAQPVGAESAKDNAWTVEYQGSTYDPGSNKTTFIYWVYDDDNTPANDHHDLSHWQLRLCSKAVMDTFNSASHNGAAWDDPHSPYFYIKWDTKASKETHRGRNNKEIFTFTLNGYWGEGNQNTAETKAGTKENFREIIGPDCAPSDPPAYLTLVKNVEGGTAKPGDFPLFIQKGNDEAIKVASHQKVTLKPGFYKVYEQTRSGYEPGWWTGACNPEGDVELKSGNDLTCAITNTFVPARLTVIKNVEGGNAQAKDFTMIVADGGGKTIDTFPGAVGAGTTVGLPGSGSFTVSETGGPTDYAPTFEGDCSGDYKPGDELTCIITNTFGEQPPVLQKLKLTSMCSENPDEQRRWRVRNPNGQPMTFTFDVYGTAQSGTLTVPANGELFFWTETVPGANTVRIFVNETLNDTKASSDTRCAKATLTLRKTTNRSTGGDMFNFAVVGANSQDTPLTATLGRNGTETWAVVADQSYTITESVTSGWTLANVACSINGDPITELDWQGQSVTVLVPDLGSHVSCTFHNTKPGDDTPPPPPPPSDDDVIEDTKIIPVPPASEPETEDEITPEAPASGPDLPFTGGSYLWYLLGGAALTVASGGAALRRRR